MRKLSCLSATWILHENPGSVFGGSLATRDSVYNVLLAGEEDWTGSVPSRRGDRGRDNARSHPVRWVPSLGRCKSLHHLVRDDLYPQLRIVCGMYLALENES